MIICPKCGKEVPEGAAVCPECGFEVLSGQCGQFPVSLDRDTREPSPSVPGEPSPSVPSEPSPSVPNEPSPCPEQERPVRRVPNIPRREPDSLPERPGKDSGYSSWPTGTILLLIAAAVVIAFLVWIIK